MTAPVSTITAIIALVISVAAAAITYWQTRLVRQSIEAQTFTVLLDRARGIDISSALDFIGTLQYTDYASYKESVPQEQQAQVRAVADFFNDLSYMMRGKYIDDVHPMRIYQPALFTCAKRLLPWWLDGIRAETYPTLYTSFGWLCEYGTYLEEEKKKTKHRQIKTGYRSYLKSRGIA
jgi:hypothetical protein